MSSLSDAMDIDIEVRRRGNRYILIVHRFGVVVRSNELKSGIEELERRVAIIGDDLREAGIPIPSGADRISKNEMRLFERLTPALIIIVTVAAMLAGLAFLVTAPIVSALANLRAGISVLVPSQEGRSIAAVGRVGLDLIVKVSQTIEQVTPERKEELRTAIRRIAREVDSIIADVKSPQPPPPLNGEKR